MDRPRITGIDKAVEDFLSAWYAPDDYIKAHTSGSTGRPKEIRLKKSDMIVSATATCRFFGLSSSSHLVMPLSADYIAGKMMIVRAIVSGARLTVVPPTRDLRHVSNISGRIDLIPIVPSQIDGLITNADLSQIANVIIGGAPMTPQQEQTVISQNISAYVTYGMTETCSHVALRRVGYDSCFEALPGISFETDADDCLIINAPDYSSCRFHTTDIVSVIDAHHFRWIGRKDHVINTGGIKILPEEAESRLMPFFPGRDFYITSRPSEKWGQEIVMVVANHGTHIDLSAPLRLASEALSHHLLPKAIIQVPEFEYTSTGKILRTLPDNCF